MGYYINPTDGTSKEQWLKRHGTRATPTEIGRLLESKRQDERFEHMVPVCLVDNGWMTAAGIGYSVGEASHFLDTTDDGRPRTWYLVKRDDLKPFCSVL